MHQHSFTLGCIILLTVVPPCFFKNSKYCDCREGWHPRSCCSVTSKSALWVIAKFWHALRFCCCDVSFWFLHCVRFCACKVWCPQNYCLGTCYRHSCLNSPSSFSYKKHPSSKGPVGASDMAGWGSHKGQSWHSMVLIVRSVPPPAPCPPPKKKLPKNHDPFWQISTPPKLSYLPIILGHTFCFSKKKKITK